MTQSVKRDGWATVKIGDLCKIKHGFAFKGEYFSDSGDYILLTPGNFSERDGLRLRGDKEKYYTGEVPKDYLLQKGAMLVVMTDLKQDAPYLGAPGIVRETNLLHNQRLGLVEEVNEDLVVPDFLYWIFQSNAYRAQVRGSATGATVRHTAPDRLYACSINIPENLEIQRKIASILFIFDNLIENNTKRINILEDTARLIYREWFVHYRFPDHEKARMVDSDSKVGEIPDGWEICPIDGLIEIQSGYPFKSGTFAEDGKWKLVTIKNVQDGYFVSECKDKLDELPSNMKEHCHLKDSDILMSLTGNIGRVCLVYGEDYVLNQRVAKLHPREERFRAFTYCKFRDTDFQKKLELLANGVAQQNLSPVETKRIEILKPTDEVMDSFDKLTSPMIHMISLLHKRNHYLRNTRDLLLPKLISGQLTVA